MGAQSTRAESKHVPMDAMKAMLACEKQPSLTIMLQEKNVFVSFSSSMIVIEDASFAANVLPVAPPRFGVFYDFVTGNCDVMALAPI
jgi:hypothetical protein